MLLGMLLLGGPLALFLALAALPGHWGRLALWTAWAAIIGLWIALILSVGPFLGVRRADAILTAALALWSVAWLAGGLLATLRPRLARAGRAAYPLAVAGALAVVLFGVLPYLAL